MRNETKFKEHLNQSIDHSKAPTKPPKPTVLKQHNEEKNFINQNEKISLNPFDDEEEVDFSVSTSGDSVQYSIIENKILNELSKPDVKTPTIEMENIRQSTRSNPGRSTKQKSKFLKTLSRIDNEIGKDPKINPNVSAINSQNENDVIRFLLSERVYGYPNSNGSIISNYKHYVLNNHPLISIFFANWKHPLEKKRRVIIFFCILSFTIFTAYILQNTDLFIQLSRCRDGCNNVQTVYQLDGNGRNTSTLICTDGFNDGLRYDRYESKCMFYQSWMLTAFCGALTVIYGSILRFLATCGCLQGRDFFQNNCCGSRLKKMTEMFGGNLLSIFVVLSAAMIISTVIEVWIRNIGYSILAMIVYSKLWSFAQWFLWTAPYFSYRYPIDRKYFYKYSAHSQIIEAVNPVSDNEAL